MKLRRSVVSLALLGAQQTAGGGGVCVAFWIGWKLPTDSWDLGEGFWMLRWVGRGLVREFADGGIFGQKRLQVFEVDDWL